jgi:hypothetical protein
LFPDAVVVYGFETRAGYVRKQTLEVGQGYWILVREAQSYTLTGQPIQEYTIPVDADGWLLIGACTEPAKASVDTGNVGVIYRFTQGFGYQRVPPSGHLEAGQGYWILIRDVVDQATLTVQPAQPAVGNNLMASEGPQAPVEAVEAESLLTSEALSPIVDAAIVRWTEALGSDEAIAAALHEVIFQLTDFDDLTLGQAIEDTILIDSDAAGYGWFVDETPSDDVEFGIDRGDGELLATADSEAYGQMDLLTVVTHELGHELGLAHAGNQLMAESLDAGVRRLPATNSLSKDQSLLQLYVAKLNTWRGALAQEADILLSAWNMANDEQDRGPTSIFTNIGVLECWNIGIIIEDSLEQAQVLPRRDSWCSPDASGWGMRFLRGISF